MNNEDKIHINSFKFYDRDELEELTKEYYLENQQLKEDISFCLKSIKQEMEMSTDSRTKQEMLSCYQILSKWSDK